MLLIPLMEADERCGGKAANLGRLLRAGFDVPAGWVVLDALGSDEWVEELGEGTRAVGSGSVAVRSSAVGEDGKETSFAGQLHSALDVTELVQVVEQVRRVARSGTSPRAIAYASRMGVEAPEVVPVIVQRMVPSNVAGVMFTSHPVTGEPVTVIEAGRGLGDDIVGGTVNPWAYVVDGQTVTMSPAGGLSVGQGSPLTQPQVRTIAELGRRVEAVFGCPQDIEWAIAENTAWLLQTRPITTGQHPPRRSLPAPGLILTTGVPASPGTARGPARIIRGTDDFSRFRPGEVLVCRTTSPAWTPLLAHAAAIVTETGGLLSHAAIVAREFGIPAVLATDDAMSALTDGQDISVDGTTGIVTLTNRKQIS